jgi:hypothetical protein
MTGQTKEKFLNNLINWSDLEENFKEQIKQGKFTVNN